jgi:hypothetical protein
MILGKKFVVECLKWSGGDWICFLHLFLSKLLLFDFILEWWRIPPFPLLCGHINKKITVEKNRRAGVIEKRCNVCIAEVVWNVLNPCSLIVDIAKGYGRNL